MGEESDLFKFASNMSHPILIALPYWGNIRHYHELFQASSVEFDIFTHYQKRQNTNRCYILSANGIQLLSVPLVKTHNHTPFYEVKISYAEDWRKNHWQSILSAYGRSAFFEYYEREIRVIYQQEFEYLKDLNWATYQIVEKIIYHRFSAQFATQYYHADEFGGIDLSKNVSSEAISKFDYTPYPQVFMDRMSFQPNLSILDLIFNVGPEAVSFLVN